MGDKHWYICLDCENVQHLEDYEGIEFLRKHWAHKVLEADYDIKENVQVFVLGSESDEVES